VPGCERATIHNYRNFKYLTDVDYTPRWETRIVDLAQLRGLDIFLTYWGSPLIAHPNVNFQFGSDDITISIETRKESGENYSALRGLLSSIRIDLHHWGRTRPYWRPNKLSRRRRRLSLPHSDLACAKTVRDFSNT